MNILITGGTGFIGRHLISDFLSRSPDIDFTVLTRKKAKQVSWLFPGITPGKLQIINDTGELHDRHPDIIIHLAGAPVFSMLPFFENTAELTNSRTGYTAKLLTRLAAAGILPDTIIMAGSTGIYPPNQIPCPEETPSGNSFPAMLAKNWENAAAGTLEELRQSGIISKIPRLVTMRFSTVMGKSGGFLKPFLIAKGQPVIIPGNGNNMLSWISIPDTMEIAWNLVRVWRNFSGSINLAVPVPLSLNEICHDIAELNRAICTVHLPETPLKIVKPKTAAFLLLSNTARPDALTRLGYCFRYENFREYLKTII